MAIKNKKSGFSLIEMIISIGIFAFAVVTISTMLLSVKMAQFKAAAIQDVVDNVRFALEAVTKELRTGTNYQVVSCDGVANTQINFVNQEYQKLAYAFYTPSGSTGGIYKIVPDVSGNLNCTNISGADHTSSALTSPEVYIDSLPIRTIGLSEQTRDGQPMIIISFKSRSVAPQLQAYTTMNLQTTVTSRIRQVQ